MVQACQTTQVEGSNSAQHDGVPVQHQYRGDMEHIILRRPHTALLLSTIPGNDLVATNTLVQAVIYETTTLTMLSLSIV